MAKAAKKAAKPKAAKPKKVGAKTAAKKPAKKAAGIHPGKMEDSTPIRVVGEHKRRPGSVFHGHYEKMKKTKTLGAYRAADGEMAALRAAAAEGYVKLG